MLTVVTSLARQTARGARDLDDFLVRFSARLSGLSVSDDLLLGKGSHPGPMEQVVRAHLRAFSELDDQRVVISGPEFFLKKESIQAIGMAIHELGTNSVKYGALSVPAGRLEIIWNRDRHDDVPVIRLCWRESGLSGVRQSARRGFGHQVVTLLTPRAVSGSVRYDFRDDGIEWALWKPETENLSVN